MSDDIKAKQNDVKLYATQAQQADKNENQFRFLMHIKQRIT